MKTQYTIPIFLPYIEKDNYFNYSNQKTEELTVVELKETIDSHLNKIDEENVDIEVAFFGESFTKLDLKKQQQLLNAIDRYVKQKKITSIRIVSKPEYISKENLKMLKKYNVKTIELEILSTNNYILKKCGRDTGFEEIKKAAKLIKWHRFNLGCQIMIGMPESNKIDELNTAKDIIKLKPKMITIFPAIIIKDTKLEEDYKNGVYEPITLERAIERCKELVYLFNKNKINIIRIYSQNCQELHDSMNIEGNVVGGPYHPEFSHFVEDSIWYDSIVEQIKKFNVKVKVVKFIVNPIDVENVIGFEKSNAEKLKELYNVDIIVEPNEDIKPGKSEIEIIKKYED